MFDSCKTGNPLFMKTILFIVFNQFPAVRHLDTLLIGGINENSCVDVLHTKNTEMMQVVLWM